ncbi:MAG: zinc protease [Acidithiobacillales bacterium SG8_45]|jgi:zinc protease|nr:MAG: zinc protease [Acidithiobacillales bacterium SG8_45]
MGIKRLFLLIVLLASSSVWASPDIQHWTLKNGARVYFVESHELPMVRVSMVFDAGSSRDQNGLEGQSMFANHLLDEGTTELGADEIAARLEGLGAELSTSVDLDMASVGIRSLSDKEKLAPALDILTQLVTRPAFPQASLERERQRLLVGLERAEQEPDDKADKTFNKLVFGAHPYGRPSNGDKKSAKAITRDDLVRFHQQYYVGANAIVVIVGDVSKSRAKRIARKLVGSLPAGSRAAPLPPVRDLAQAETRRIVFPSTQTHILMGMPGMRRSDPDYFPLYVGNYILGGGGLVSRLSQEIREKRGLSYSVYSYFYPLRDKGPFVMGLQTRNNQRDQALKVMRDTLTTYIDKGPSEAELEAAKKHITGGFALRLDSSGKIAGYLAVLGFYQLPLTYLDDFNQKIEAVTLEQVKDAFKRRIDPNRMVTVVVGGKG